MPSTVHTLGPARIRVDTGAANALEELGYSAEGVTIREEARRLDVPGDENGGSEGVPIDIQYLGQIHFVTFELTKYDELILDKLTPRIYGGTAGTEGTIGTLLVANGFRLLIHSTTEPRNYLLAMPLEPVETNKGTKFSRVIMGFECYPSSGTIYNASTS